MWNKINLKFPSLIILCVLILTLGIHNFIPKADADYFGTITCQAFQQPTNLVEDFCTITDNGGIRPNSVKVYQTMAGNVNSFQDTLNETSPNDPTVRISPQNYNCDRTQVLITFETNHRNHDHHVIWINCGGTVFQHDIRLTGNPNGQIVASNDYTAVPEFGSLAVTIMAISIIGVLFLSRRFT